jgi:hypothetical protein
MQDEWDIEMPDDDEGLPLIPNDEQYSRYGGGATIQDILSGEWG